MWDKATHTVPLYIQINQTLSLSPNHCTTALFGLEYLDCMKSCVFPAFDIHTDNLSNKKAPDNAQCLQ